MATPLASAVLQAMRPVNQSGQPSWTLVQADVLGQAPAGTIVARERTGVQAWSLLGLNIGSAPTAAQMAAGLIAHGQASAVYYVESWLQDGRVLGTGFVTWWYIAVYKAA